MRTEGPLERRRTMRLVLICGAVAILGAAMTAAVVLQRRPSVERRPLTGPDVARAERIVTMLESRPGSAGPAPSRHISTSDLDLAVSYLIDRHAHVQSSVILEEGQARLHVCVPVSVLSRYVNLDVRLAPDGTQLRLTRLRIGRLPIPRPIANRLAFLGWRVFPGDDLRRFHDAVRVIAISSSALTLAYRDD